MKYVARLITASEDSKSVSSALEVDNVSMDGLRVSTGFNQGKVVSEVESDNIKTLINTLDDIICCQMASERALNKKQNG